MTQGERDVEASKLLSYVLRHHPEQYGLRLDAAGWADVAELLAALALDAETLVRVLAGGDKQRFELSADGARVRARHGHSLAVELEYPPAAPPPVLYHGTVSRFLPSIRAQGLLRGARRHVHLSETVDQARAVGARRGAPVVLAVRAGAMAAAGHVFFSAHDGVWLCERVPAEFIEFMLVPGLK